MSNDFTVNLVSRSLDCLLMRQAAIANNIANANSVNYQPIKVDFEQQLQAASNSEQLATISPSISKEDGVVQIDKQMVASVENSTWYRALIKGVNQHFSLMQTAIKG